MLKILKKWLEVNMLNWIVNCPDKIFQDIYIEAYRNLFDPSDK